MSVRKPLVLSDTGEVQQLQSGDTLNVPISGGVQVTQTNGESSAALVIGAPVYNSANATAKRAKADASGTAGVVGLWASTSTAASSTGSMQTNGVLTATTGQWDAVVTGASGGLVANTRYLLDPANAGKLIPASSFTNTPGQFLVPIGRAISTTDMVLDIGKVIAL